MTLRRSINFSIPLASLLFSTALWAGQAASSGRSPVLLELFTSEGCSDCPPADDLLRKLDSTQPIKGADLIVLSEHVDYWNHGGWSDPFSSAAFSARQNDYSQVFGLDEVYTPQLVVDGAAQVVGSRAGAVREAVGKALEHKKVPVTISNAARQSKVITAHVKVGPLPAPTPGAAIYLAVADNEDHSEVGGGENSGRGLTHVAVVRTLEKVGPLSAAGFDKDVRFPLRSNPSGSLRLVVFIQDRSTRHVLGAAQVKLDS